MRNLTHGVFVTAVFVSLGVLLVFGAAATHADASGRTTRPGLGPVTAWGGCIYIVQPGDTLYSIGARYGVSAYYLAYTNGLYNPNYIYAGMRLEVPCSGFPQYPPKYPPKYPPHPPCSQDTQYRVRYGDTLYGIALRYGTTVNALRDANQLWGHVLYAGTILKIPCPGTGDKPTRTATAPSDQPTVTPTSTFPSDQPTVTPTVTLPSEQPTVTPTATFPSDLPTFTPTATFPSDLPTFTPTATFPSDLPTFTPTATSQSDFLPPEPSAKVVIGVGPDPLEAQIKIGESIVWVNNTGETITILSGIPGQPDGTFNSGPLPDGGTFVATLTVAGDYPYFVMEYPTMVGHVIVSP